MEARNLFETLARSTWRTLARTQRRRILLGEDAITSMNLMALTSLRNGIVVEDTRVNEARKGCDFELWIGTDSHGWCRYAIQAKKITVSTATYKNLNHLVGGRRQIDVLDRYAKANKAAGLYCFYNYSQHPSGWNCPLRPDLEQLGCSVTPLNVVRESLFARGRRNFSWVHQRPETLPWRCLVRCLHFVSDLGVPAHAGWPSANSYFHEQLPHSLQRLREARTTDVLLDAPDLFSPELPLRPGWVGIIEVDGEQINED